MRERGTQVEAKFAIAGLWQATLRNAEWGAIGTVVFAASSTAVAAAFWWMAVRESHAAWSSRGRR